MHWPIRYAGFLVYRSLQVKPYSRLVGFPLAWSFLYACLATVGWQLWYRETPMWVKTVFCVQMILNFTWSLLFLNYWVLSSLLSIVCMLGLTIRLFFYGFEYQLVTLPAYPLCCMD